MTAMFRHLLTYLHDRKLARENAALTTLKARYHTFRIFLENNGRALELLVTIDSLLHRGGAEDIRSACEELLSITGELVDGLNLLADDGYTDLYAFHGRLSSQILQHLGDLAGRPEPPQAYCLALDDLEPGLIQKIGAKAANLAHLRRMSLPVPDGFVCTTRACRQFLHSGELSEKIRKILGDLENGRLDGARASSRIKEMVLATPLPPDIVRALQDAYAGLERRTMPAGRPAAAPLAVSVRSSGVAEDGSEHSFAGQFSSLLNIHGPEALLAAYREVVASVFNARAIAYRLKAGLAPVDLDFAVLCQVMVDAECAGVMFTRDPSHPERQRMAISAVAGLGITAVDGSVPADMYYPPRMPPGDSRPPEADRDSRLMADAAISTKTLRQVPAAGGGLRTEAMPAEAADAALLSPARLDELVRSGELIEGFEGCPQDVEWAYSHDNRLYILQTRPLRLAATRERIFSYSPASPPLATGRCASPGTAVGKACVIHSAKDLQQLDPAPAGNGSTWPLILILPQSIIDAARYLHVCSGAVVATGNPTDHLSCIAREYAVPLITGAQEAMARIGDGQWIIVDADHGTVMEAPEPLQTTIRPTAGPRPATATPAAGAATATASPLRQALRAAVAQLNLTDTYGPTFSARECRSIHDLIRYTHEMAVLAMFDTGDEIMKEAGDLLRPLDLGIPFSFLVIDVGGGVRKAEKITLRERMALRHPLHRQDILSVPLAALCDGLLTHGLSWHSAPDAEALAGIFSRTMLDGRGVRPAGSFNYAIAARDYLNLNARVEFHFAMLDSVCGRDAHANYIRFRFKGGGAGQERGHRRVLFLQHVLEANSFYTSMTGDLITAFLTGVSREVTQQQLVMLGRLFGFSRFLDGIMVSEDTPRQLAAAFLAGRFDTRDLV